MSQLKERRGKGKKSAASLTEATNSHDVCSSKDDEVDYSTLSVKELSDGILAISKDPRVEKLLNALIEKIPGNFSSVAEEERSRTIVVSGIEELGSDSKIMERQAHVERQVSEILEVLGVECRPHAVYRLGKWDGARIRLVKVILSSRSHWSATLANAHRLRLKCLLTNARSLGNKLHHLHCLLSTQNPDLVFICETWFSSKISNSEVVGNLPYLVFRCDRKGNRGGGVCCLAKHSITIKEHTIIQSLKSDLLCLDVYHLFSSTNLRVILAYRPPNSSVRDDKCLVDLLENLCASASMSVVLGDFNIDANWTTFKPSISTHSTILNFFASCGFTQQVHKPTRMNSILDVILTSSPIVKDVHITPPLSTSDHNVVTFYLETEHVKTPALPMPDFLRADYTGLSNYLSRINWWDVFQDYVNVDDVYKKFCRVIYSGFAKFVPMRSPKVCVVKYPMHIRNLLEQKERLFTTLSNPLSSPLYRKVCADLHFHIIKFQSNYEGRLAKTRGMKALFSLIRSKMNGKVTLPVILDHDGNHCVDDKDKANALGSYFASVFSSACSQSDIPESGVHISKTFPYMVIAPGDVLRYLKRLRPSVSSSIDGIPQIFYKNCAEFLSEPLTIIFNISLLFGKVPGAWKDAIVTAIPKSVKAHMVSEFRPISICPTPVKVLEKILRDKLSAWFIEHKLVPPEQHGFCSGASTSTQLTDTAFDWICALNSKESIDVIYLDLSKAFDKVNHVKLLSKIEQLGISTQIMMWLKSYLSSRHLYVKGYLHISE
ncbi:hypothetical protein Y032_0001g311 [Ancylostoma ceylanicum]|uniref:Reverse transcriptase domain-containing protein n=1 Tax=Ancylostoma ceylanicum TaxID=53326 RepID=A0A016W3J6_9BILA|nr:hypothetical protein Y032_0001g311 [Ancylostoma ceylanicum]